MKSDSSSSPWNNFHTTIFSFDHDRRNTKELPALALVLEAGGGAGVGCGLGFGFGLVGGIGHGGASPWNHLHLVFGLGAGCGVGLGLGIGQGFGYGFSFESLDSYFSHLNSDPKHKQPSLIQFWNFLFLPLTLPFNFMYFLLFSQFFVSFNIFLDFLFLHLICMHQLHIHISMCLHTT